MFCVDCDLLCVCLLKLKNVVFDMCIPQNWRKLDNLGRISLSSDATNNRVLFLYCIIACLKVLAMLLVETIFRKITDRLSRISNVCKNDNKLNTFKRLADSFKYKIIRQSRKNATFYLLKISLFGHRFGTERIYRQLISRQIKTKYFDG